MPGGKYTEGFTSDNGEVDVHAASALGLRGRNERQGATSAA